MTVSVAADQRVPGSKLEQAAISKPWHHPSSSAQLWKSPPLPDRCRQNCLRTKQQLAIILLSDARAGAINNSVSFHPHRQVTEVVHILVFQFTGRWPFVQEEPLHFWYCLRPTWNSVTANGWISAACGRGLQTSEYFPWFSTALVPFQQYSFQFNFILIYFTFNTPCPLTSSNSRHSISFLFLSLPTALDFSLVSILSLCHLLWFPLKASTSLYLLPLTWLQRFSTLVQTS